MIDPHLPMDAAHLRAQLNDPQPMQRALALHALERACADCSAHRVASEAERFAARGIPFYGPDDQHFRAWVDRAVALWQRLHDASAAHPLAA